MNELILEDQPLEVLTELAKGMHEECRDVLDMVIKNEKRLAHFGRVLAACRAKVPHGQWSQWVQETFSGSLPIRTAQRWIAEASDPEKAEAARAKDRQAKAAKSNAPDLAHLKPGVQVVEPGLKEEPRTNTKHTAENAKAKESEKPAPRPVLVEAELVQKTTDDFGAYLESKIAADPALAAEVDKAAKEMEAEAAAFEEKTLSDFSIREIGEYLKESAEEPKERAKWLRKLADELDPPTPNEKTPTAAALKDAVPEDLPSDLFEAAQLWAEYKQARPKADRIQSLKAWEIALKKMRSQPASVVVRKIENAIANSWKGWDHDTEHGRPLRGDEW